MGRKHRAERRRRSHPRVRRERRFVAAALLRQRAAKQDARLVFAAERSRARLRRQRALPGGHREHVREPDTKPIAEWISFISPFDHAPPQSDAHPEPLSATITSADTGVGGS